MDRRTFLVSGAVIGVSGVAARAVSGKEGKNPGRHSSASESARRIARAKAAGLAMQRKDWEQGIFAQALLEAGEREEVIRLTRAAMVMRVPDGRLAVVNSGGPTDPAMGGAAYARAAEWTRDPQIKAAVEGLLAWIRFKAPRSSDGILYHVFEGPEMWSDGFNGAPPFLAAMGHYDEALQQIDGFRKRLWIPEKKLLGHIWDEGKGRFKDASCWGGGNGWAAAGLARVIRSLPTQRRSDREQLAAFAREILDGCLAHQRPDGLFHDVVDKPDTFVETNLAQMLAYATYEGVTEGWLPRSYRAHADRMRAGARDKMDADGYIQGACGAPEFERPGTSTEAQAFCILMEAAGSGINALDRIPTLS